MKFDNLLSQSKYRVALKNAIADWMLGFDGEGFATGNVVQCIPWGDDLNAALPCDDVISDFDTAIGNRGNWCRREIVVNNADGEDLRRRFWAEVDRKCAEICEVYERAIDKANEIVAGSKEG